MLSANYACTHCSISYEPPSPQLFSFNSPLGMCLDCDGLGSKYTFDTTLLVPDPSLSFHDGAIPVVGSLKSMGKWRKHIYEGVGKSLGIDLKTPWDNKSHEELETHTRTGGDGVCSRFVWWKQNGIQANDWCRFAHALCTN